MIEQSGIWMLLCYSNKRDKRKDIEELLDLFVSVLPKEQRCMGRGSHRWGVERRRWGAWRDRGGWPVRHDFHRSDEIGIWSSIFFLVDELWGVARYESRRVSCILVTEWWCGIFDLVEQGSLLVKLYWRDTGFVGHNWMKQDTIERHFSFAGLKVNCRWSLRLNCSNCS